MIFPGHLGAGFLTTYAVLTYTGLGATMTSGQFDTLLVVGTLLGVAPDTDILFYFFQKKTLGPSQLSAHRKYLTHVPLLWFLAGAIIFLVSYFFQAGFFWQSVGLLVWLCPWSHFALDSIDCGIMWLWPFTDKQFALHNSQEQQDLQKIPGHTRWNQLFLGYLKNPLAYFEIILTVAAIYGAWFIVK